MTVEDVATRRGLTDVLHFTSNRGLTGILASRVLHPRARLHEDKYVEHVMMLNCAIRYDHDYLDYVNLSLTRIAPLINFSKGRWHAGADLWWCVLAFSPDILSHSGVIFTTTNNKYEVSVRRAEGSEGLEAMFAASVKDYESPVRTVTRRPGMPDNHTTSPQAEVLYPGDLTLDHLRTVYVESEPQSDIVHSQLEIHGLASSVAVSVNPAVFRT